MADEKAPRGKDFLHCYDPRHRAEAQKWLDPLWESFKRHYISPEGQVLDPRQSRTTSEGQSYALLRAVWMGDRTTFDRVLKWTEQHLARKDGLFSWVWKDGGVGDGNTATDADQDIALALILAADKWNRERHRLRARNLVQTIREKELLQTAMGPFPAAGDWAVKDRIANPSYFMPYAYELFEQIDPEGPWKETIECGYQVIQSLLSMPGIKLPSDFIRIDPMGRPHLLPENHSLARNFSFDAVRIYWRLSMDCRHFRRVQACELMNQAWVLAALLAQNGQLATMYSPQGEAMTDQESTSFYGALLPVFAFRFPSEADRVMREQMGSHALERLLNAPNRYYDQNWVWFGLALISDRCLLEGQRFGAKTD